MPNPAVAPAPSGRWTLHDNDAQRPLPWTLKVRFALWR